MKFGEMLQTLKNRMTEEPSTAAEREALLKEENRNSRHLKTQDDLVEVDSNDEKEDKEMVDKTKTNNEADSKTEGTVETNNTKPKRIETYHSSKTSDPLKYFPGYEPSIFGYMGFKDNIGRVFFPSSSNTGNNGQSAIVNENPERRTSLTKK